MGDEVHLHDPLPAYVAGRLDEAAAASFREHLASCAACRSELGFLQQVRAGAERYGAELFAEHPDVDDVVGFATGQEPGADDPAVARHVELCLACAAEVTWVRGEAVPAASVPAAVFRRPVAPSAVWGWATAAAAMLALALVVGLRSGSVPGDHDDGSTALGIVRPVERGAPAPNAIAVRPDAARVALSVVVDLPGSAFPASIELLDAAGSVIVRDTVRGPDALADGLFFGLSCRVDQCPVGNYSVRIAAGTAEEHRLLLSLVAAGEK